MNCKHCRDCKWWNQDWGIGLATYVEDLNKTQWGDCIRLPVAQVHYTTAELGDTKAFLEESSGDRGAWLTTLADFGCIQWEGKAT